MKKRLLCSLLAVMMLISMLAGIVLPVSAEEVASPYPQFSEIPAGYTGKDYAISSKADWLALVTATTTGSKPSYNGYTFHFTKDVDMEEEPMLPVSYGAEFQGVIDGHGYVIKNVNIVVENATSSVGLVGKIGWFGIKNLGIESGIIQATGIGSNQYIGTAGFIGQSHGAYLYKCWNGATVTNDATNTRYGPAGLIGYITSGSIVDGCYNVGTITNSKGSAHAIGSYTANNLKVYNSIAAGTVTSGTNFYGGVQPNENTFANNLVPVYNTYAVGMPAVVVGGTSGESTSVTLPDGSAFNLANTNAYYGAGSLGEAAWKANSTHTASGKGDRVYYKLDDEKGLAYGTATDRVQKITTSANGLVPNTDFYFNVGDQITAADFTDDPNAQLAVTTEGYDTIIKDGVLTVPNADITVHVGVRFGLKENYSGLKSPWFISEAEDWLKLVDAYKTTSTGIKLIVTNDIDFEETPMLPLCYATHGYTGVLDGRGYTFKNINIKMEGTYTNAHYGVALVGALSGGTIKNLGLTGSVTNESTNYLTKTAAFVAGKQNVNSVGTPAGWIKNCWADVHVKGPSNNMGQYLAVFYAYPQAELVLENCINYGTVESTSTTNNGGASVFYNRGAQVQMKNCLDFGTITGFGSGAVGAVTSHPNGIGKIMNANSYSTNNLWGMTDASAASEIPGYNLTIPGTSTAITTAQQVHDYLAVSSAEEAAWRATDGANGEVYYKLKNGKVTFGTATDRVQKITFTGYEGFDGAVYYKNVGEYLELEEVRWDLDIDTSKDYIYTIVEDAYKDSLSNDEILVPNADIIVNVTLDDRAMAKKELQGIYDVRKDYDIKYFVAGDALAQWKTNAATVLGKDEPTMDELTPLIATATNMSLDLKDDAYLPYSKKAVYSGEIDTNNIWGIETKADWMAWVDESTTTAFNYSGYKFYVTDDIDFGGDEMLPIGYGKSALNNCVIDGQGHVFTDVNIKAAGGSGVNGVALIADIRDTTSKIKNLGLASGSVTSLSNAKDSQIGSFAAYIIDTKITGCWSALTISAPMAGNGIYAGGLVGNVYRGTIDGCYFIGSLENPAVGKDTACGIVGYAGTAAGVVRNCFAAASDVSGLIGLHQNAFPAGADFNAKVGSINSYAIGFQAFDMRHTGEDAYYAVFENHADAIAAFEAKYRLDANAYKSGELAYKLTEGSAASGVYFTVKNNKTVFGTEAERAKRITVADGGVNTYYYGFEGDVIEVIAPATGKVAVDEAGNILESTSITLGASDIVITHKDFEEVDEVFLKKTELQGVIDSYKTFNPEFIQNWDEVVAWFDTAAAVIADPFATKSQVQGQINYASTLPKFATLTYPNYPSMKEYDLYRTFTLDFTVNDAEDWLKAVADSTVASRNLHLTADIDLGGQKIGSLAKGNTYGATLDGHGYVIKNFSMTNSSGTDYTNPGLVSILSGTIKNLGIADSTFKNTTNYARVGAFAAKTTASAVLYKCWSNATIEGAKGDHLGGLIGTCDSGVTVDSCYFIGTVKGNAGTASALLGYGGNKADVYNSIAAGTVTGASGSTGMIRMHANIYTDTSLMPLYNSYAVGMNVLNYNGTPVDKSLTVNGHAYNDATVQSTYVAGSLAEAAWKANAGLVGYKDSGKGLERVYYTLDAQGNLKFGSATDKVVKITVGEDSYYVATGAEITVDVPDGMVIVVTGDAKVNGNVITAGTADMTVTFVDAASAEGELAVAKQQLQNLLDQYSAREEKYFTSDAWTSYQNWINTANTALDGELSAITAAIAAGKALNMAKATLTYPDYPSIADYDAYKDTEVKHFAVGTKDEWLAAVAASSGNADAFAGATIHLTANIDMNNEPMLPLAYGGKFGGKLDGHFYGFQNVNITVNNPAGPVGLVSYLRGDSWIRNVGIDSGSINVTGTVDNTDYVGGIIGTSDTRSYLRKCWNAADIKVAANGTNVGGIVGRTGSSNVIDSCFNLGKVQGYGILGYGGGDTKLYNSFNMGQATAIAYYYVSAFRAGNATTGGTPVVNSWNRGKILTKLNYDLNSETDVADAEALTPVFQQMCEDFHVDTAGEAAWNANRNYQSSGKGDGTRAWYTVDENGMIRFGTTENQVRKVTVKIGGKVAQTYYAAAGSTIELSGELGASYFVQDGATSVLKGNKLTLGNEDVTVTAQTGIYMGDADNNGSVTLFDAITVLRSVVGLADCGAAGDVNQNGRLDANDAVLIARNWLGDPNLKDYVIRKPDSEGWIKVASYNIKRMKYDGTAAGSYDGDRIDDIVAVLKEADADIIGLQEVTSSVLSQLQLALQDEGLNYQTYFANVYNNNPLTGEPYEDYGIAVLVSDQYSFTATNAKYEKQFTYNPNNPDHAKYGSEALFNIAAETWEHRAYIRVELNVDGVDGTDLVWYNTHLGTEVFAQFGELAEAMENDRADGKKVIMTADLNISAPELKGRFDTSKFTALNGGDDFNTYLETTVDFTPIDQIMVSDNIEYYWDNAADAGIKVLDRIGAEGTYKDIPASDHSLIYGYIRLK